MFFYAVALVIFGILVFAGLTTAITAYNGLVEMRRQVDKSWANIEVVLGQRFEMIPKLIAACNKNLHQSVEVTKLSEAKKQFGSSKNRDDKIILSSEISTLIHKIMTEGERDSDLLVSSSFIEVQKALTSLEAEIAVRRNLFNESVTNFNTRCIQFPDMVFARFLHYEPLELYRGETFESDDLPTKEAA